MTPRFTTRSSFLFVASAIFAVATSNHAFAQCVDWSDGFGAPTVVTNNPVNDMLVWDDGLGGGPALYAVGGFTQAGGVSANDVARWDGTSWQALGLGLSNFAQSLVVHDDGSGPALFVGGQFQFAGGSSALGVAKWDGFAWSALGSGILGSIDCMASFDDGSGPALYVGGSFSNAGGVPVHNVARWKNGAWSDLAGGVSSWARGFLVSSVGGSPALYVCGDFTILKWTGSSWATLPTGPVGSPSYYSMVMYNDGSGSKMYVGGHFTTLNGSPIGLVASWDGTSWAKLGTVQGSGTVHKLCVYDDGSGPGLYACGPIPNIGSLVTNYVAEWKGGSWHNLGVGLQYSGSETGSCLCAFPTGAGSKLYVGGQFALAGGKPASNFARWGDPCLPPSIVQQPVDQTTVFPLASSFSITTSGLTPMTYQWRHNGTPVVDNGPISGATTPTLLLTQWNYADDGLYDCVVTNAISSVTSNTARLTVGVLPGFGGPVTVDPVLVPPLQVPNLPPGVNYVQAFDGNTGSDGSVALMASLSTGDLSMSLWQAGSIANVVRSNDPAPGTGSGVHFSSFFLYEGAAAGQLAFSASLAGPGVDGTNNRGLWYRDATAMDLVVRAGDQVPGLPAGQVFRQPDHARVNDNGVVAFFSYVFTGNTYVAEGVWSWTRAGGLNLLALRNTSAPGTSAHFKQFDPTIHPVISNDGVQVLSTLDTFTSFHVFASDDSGVWLGTPGNLQLQMKSGDPAIGMAPNTVIDAFLAATISSDGASYVRAATAGPTGSQGNCLYKSAQGTVSAVVLKGDPAPDGSATATFSNPMAFAADPNGDVLIYSDIFDSCSSCPSEGVFVKDGAGLHVLATNRADPLPSVPPNMFVQGFDSGALNDSGWALFHVTLSNSYSAIYGWTQTTGLFPIVVPGTQLEIAPGVYRTCNGGWFGGEISGESPVAHSHELTNDGHFTFEVGFWTGGNVVLQGQFQVFLGAAFGPGHAYCFGDGTGHACPCGNTGASGEGCANSKGHGAVLNALGSISVSDDNLRFDASGLPFHKSTLLFQAPNQAGGGNGVAFGDGLLCVGGQIKRIGLKSSDANGFASFGPGLSSFAQWTAGQTRRFQVWYRDSAGPCVTGTNLSNAYEVTFIQ